MSLFELYTDPKKHSDLTEIFTVGAQLHPGGLPANFLEKDVWVTEILRLLYDESLLGDCSVAFKGGTAANAGEQFLVSLKILTFQYIGLICRGFQKKRS